MYGPRWVAEVCFIILLTWPVRFVIKEANTKGTMNTTKETLDYIQNKYPEAITNLPKGWRFLNDGEKLRNSDKYWSDWGEIGFFPVPESGLRINPYMKQDYLLPHIRRIRSPKKKKPLDLNEYNVGDQFLARDGTILVMVKNDGVLFDFRTIDGKEYGSADRYSDGLARHFPSKFVSYDVVSFYKKRDSAKESNDLKKENAELKERILKLEKIIADIKGLANI